MFQNIWYQAGRSIVDFYARGIMRVDIHHDAPFPKGAKIIVVNHPSTNDPAFVTTLSREHMTILIKETVFKVPLFGRSLRLSGHVPVVAGSGRAAFDEGLRLLRAGCTVMIFPEGDISPEEGFQKAHTGAARLAMLSGAPVVPVGISLDCRRRRVVHAMIAGEMEPSSWYLKGPYAMTVGESVCFAGSTDDREQVRLVTGQIMSRLSTLSARGQTRLAVRGARRSSHSLEPRRALRSGPEMPNATLNIAWHGTRLGFQQSAHLFAHTGAFRVAESLLMFLMMFARQFVS